METRVMTMTEIKNRHLGNGLRRLRYEKRLERIKDMAPFDVGMKWGMNLDQSIMLQEYVENWLDEFTKSVFISSN
jgi:hypothetical protein